MSPFLLLEDRSQKAAISQSLAYTQYQKENCCLTPRAPLKQKSLITQNYMTPEIMCHKGKSGDNPMKE